MKSFHTPPLGLLYIGRALEDEGHKVSVIEFFDEENPKEKLLQSLHSVDVVGLSISTNGYKEAANVAQTIREHDPSIPIVIGGPHCTFHPRQSLVDIPTADFSVEGEGDIVIKDVVKSLEGIKQLADVAGVHYRENNEIHSGQPLQIITNLDSLPFPARHLVESYEYGKLNNSFLFKPKLTSMVTSRGCPHHCRFCTRHVVTYKRYRQRSAEDVVQEIREIGGTYRSVMIMDDNFLTDRKRANQIMDGIIESGIDIDLLIAAVRVDSADRKLYQKMKKAGVKYMGFGIESGCQDVLDYYRKNITLDQIRNAVDLSREMNFITIGHFILGSLIETREHIEQTLSFACSLPLDIALFFPLYYMYGSDLWDEYVQKGVIDENDGYAVIADSTKGLSNFSGHQLEAFCNQATKRFYFRSLYIIKQLFRSVRRNDFNLLRIQLRSL